MDAPALLLFIVAAANVMLGLVVYSRHQGRRQHWYYLGMALSVGLWTATNGLFRILPVADLLPVALASYAGAILTATFFLLFNRAFTHRRPRVPDEVILAFGFLAAASSLIPGFMASDVTTDRSIVTSAGITSLAIVLAGFFIWGLALLVREQHRVRSVQRNQIQLMLLGMAIAITMGLMFNLVLPLLYGNYAYVYLGPAFTLVYLGVIAYAIIKHRLFDIRVIVARSVTYLLLLLTLAAVYTLAAFEVGGWFFHDTPADQGHQTYNVILAVTLAFLFQPLRRLFAKITDRIFYRNRYDSQVVLNRFSHILVSELELDRILRRALTDLCREIHIQYGQIVVLNNERVYRVEHYGPLPRKLMVAPELRRLNHPLLVADELEPGSSVLSELKELLEDHGIRVSLTLQTREEHIGFLLLGDKLSGGMYSSQDLELLEIMAKQLAVAISNARAYAEIEAFNVTLQQRVDHATNRLRVANRHLKELDRAKDEFISMASHQLRTPLTTIKGYLSMMLEGDAGSLTGLQKDFVGYAFGASERMVNLISDLLNVSRLSAGRFLIQTRPTNMVDMVTEEVRQLQSHAINKHIFLRFELPPKPLPLIEIDDNKTRQVIMNFIDNAIYYTHEGGVTVRLDQTGDRVRLTVTDTGIGVPQAAQKKLFTKFYRADNAQAVRPDGTGLGLYLARRVVEDQGGTIIFESTEGKGSTFGFELPLKAVDPKPTKPKKETHG